MSYHYQSRHSSMHERYMDHNEELNLRDEIRNLRGNVKRNF